MIGTKLAHYEITSHLGTGGMGEVYQATDTRLGRSVAIKVLPALFAQDADCVSRLEREARVLASLNHPNIAAIYGLEEFNGRRFLVLELVPGETLAERIKTRLMSLQEALGIAKEIADALEAAHRKGIIHRDLKPANVKVTPDGKVKLLDFGLARAFQGGVVNSNLSLLPTMSTTATGGFCGTAAYMSPEQARGRETDARSDIFSFGCVLYEMLTRREAFQGETTADIVAAVLMREPDLDRLPASASPKLKELLLRCFDKDPERRWHAAGDVRIEIEAVLAEPHKLRVEPRDRRNRFLSKRAIPAVASAVLAALVTGGVMWYFAPVAPQTPATVPALSKPENENTVVRSTAEAETKSTPPPQSKLENEITVASELQKLQGTWIVVSGEQHGQLIDAPADPVVLAIEGNRITLSVGKDPQSISGKLRIDPRQNPKRMDWTDLRSGEKDLKISTPGIYRLDGDTLTFCSGRERPTTFTTKSAPELDERMLVFKRKKN